MAYGKCEWLIADCYLDSHSTGLYESHEAVCVLNCADADAEIMLSLYFEDREPEEGIAALCPARRTRHIRMDKVRMKDGSLIPRDTPYALRLVSSVPVVVQYSRLDSAQSEMALMTTMAY